MRLDQQKEPEIISKIGLQAKLQTPKRGPKGSCAMSSLRCTERKLNAQKL